MTYHVCSRCHIDSGRGPKDARARISFQQIKSCALVRGDWMCSPCWGQHRLHCPACRARRKAA